MHRTGPGAGPFRDGVDFHGPWASTPTTTVTDLIGRPAVPGTEAVQRRVGRFAI